MHNKYRSGFTLAEVLVVTVIAGFIFMIIISLYTNMMSVRVDMEAKQSLIQSSYFTMEKINVFMQDYTIDYEEYFDRKVVGCNTTYGDNFTWAGGMANGYCEKPTYYGNKSNNNGAQSDSWSLYSCSSSIASNDTTYNVVKENNAGDLKNGSGCLWNATPGVQSFGEYKKQYWDVGKSVAGGSPVGDDDDKDLGIGPVAVADNTGVQELYLINKDSNKRLLIRREKVGTSVLGDLYNLKMLKLRGFDAGIGHDFAGDGTYDGQIDTWACDHSEGYACNGSAISNAIYPGYNLPAGVNDGWVEVFGRDLNIVGRNLQVYPNRNPKVAWSMNDLQINPYIKVYMKTKLNPNVWGYKIGADRINKFEMDLQTTFNVKSNY